MPETDRQQLCTDAPQSWLMQRLPFLQWMCHYQLIDLQTDPDRQHNLRDNPDHQYARRQMIRELLLARRGNEPLWMPRIIHA